MRFNDIDTESSLGSDFNIDFSFEINSLCPICNMGSAPNLIQTYIPNFHFGYALFECVLCNECFLSKFDLKHDITFEEFKDSQSPQISTGSHVSSFPSVFRKKEFGPHITDLSPKFSSIYNQALQAESMKLDEIAGIAYRKSAEFLIKDYLIYQYPDSKSIIEDKLLKPCIDQFLENGKLKTLALASAWIGNDEAHYKRKHADKDVISLKKYIEAFVHFLEFELTFEEATELVNRPKR